MPLSKLCYILPTIDIAEDVGEPDSTTSPKEESCPRKDRRTCHDRLLSFIKNTLRRVYCGCDGPFIFTKGKNNVTRQLSFHDITGVEFTTKVDGKNQPRIFSYAELYIGSKGFNETELLGSGGFGRVYKAVLPSDGTEVAVKCVAENRETIEKTFAAELVAVAHLRHRNLVRLRGWCVHEDQLLLVYDYMPNRSLDRVLFKRVETPGSGLDYEQRRRIVIGLAAALFYLHEQLETQIIHRDVKSSNVMLDSSYNARLGDFGLARWVEHHDLESRIKAPSMRDYDDQFKLAETTRIGGTIGYLPPESFLKRYVATAKSDVFSFGIVVLEVVSGRRAVDLAYPDDKIILLDWVRRLADQGKFLEGADPRLPDGSYALYEMERLIHIGLLCTVHDPKSRPNMKWVLDALCGNVMGKLPALPSFKTHPLYISMSSSSDDTSSGKSTTITFTSHKTDDSTTSTIYITAVGKTIFVTADDGERSNSCSGKKPCLGSGSGSGSGSSSGKHFPVVETPREISFQEIISATDNFSDKYRVAELDFGTAYHGFLENRHHVLVKRLNMKTCPALRARFSTELQNLGRLRHRNLIQLRGWCTEQGEMLVVYDYLASRLLSHMLFHHQQHNNVLKWSHRYNIIRSLASAVLYLHEEWDEQVIHKNITSSSVVVDPDMNPRLTSFALAEFLTRNEHDHHVTPSTTDSVRGIFGYMAPEYMNSGEANTGADVYSFGVVVLEVITGQMAVDCRHPEVMLVKRVREFEGTLRCIEELADPNMDGQYDLKQFVRLVMLGLACTHSDPLLRPSMRQIASILDGNSLRLVESRKEGVEEWKQRNALSLSYIRRIQALGLQ
ncbi:receptor like protein kinase S.2 [Silene latifolia]|uniref:receptor like protein kinase S.2 n=1 Tax=Silene latifolia TaxID=37657 RepID=UPI003D78A185